MNCNAKTASKDPNLNPQAAFVYASLQCGNYGKEPAVP